MRGIVQGIDGTTYPEFCDECSNDKEEVIEFADHRLEEFDVTDYPLKICLDCIKKALSNYEEMIKEAKEQKLKKDRERAIRKNNAELRLSAYVKSYIPPDPYDI